MKMIRNVNLLRLAAQGIDVGPLCKEDREIVENIKHPDNLPWSIPAKDKDSSDPGILQLDQEDLEGVILGAKKLTSFSIHSSTPMKDLDKVMRPIPKAKRALIGVVANDIAIKEVRMLYKKAASFMPKASIVWGYRRDAKAKGIRMFVLVGE